MKLRVLTVLSSVLLFAGSRPSSSQNVVLFKPPMPLVAPSGPKPDVACPLFHLSHNGYKQGPLWLNFRHVRLAPNNDLTKDTEEESTHPEKVKVAVDPKANQPYALADVDEGNNYWTIHLNQAAYDANKQCLQGIVIAP